MASDIGISSKKTFNYDLTKKIFEQGLEYFLFSYYKPQDIIRNIAGITKAIAEHKINTKVNLSGERYVVSNENGKDILCKVISKAKNQTTPHNIVQMLSIEECFDILAELYLCEPHLDTKEIIEICSNCFINPTYIKSLWMACGEVKYVKKYKFKLVGEVEVISVSQPDNEFVHVLVYVERNTNFIILRPLKAVTKEIVAYELLSIFCDFGPPKFVNIRRKQFFKTVWKVMSLLNLPFMLPTLYTSYRIYKSTLILPKISMMLKDSIEKSSNQNWSIGLHVLEWILNTSLPSNTYIRSNLVRGLIKCSYHAMFGIMPHEEITEIKLDGIKPSLEPTKKTTKVLIDCAECNQPMYKVYKCNYCEKGVHFFCCNRVIESSNEVLHIINICFTCANKMPAALHT